MLEGSDHILILFSFQALPPKLRLRLKIGYSKNGENVQEQVDWSEPA